MLARIGESNVNVAVVVNKDLPPPSLSFQEHHFLLDCSEKKETI